MTTYAIQAPDGNTYQIDGPAGATDEEVRNEVLRQHPNAGGETHHMSERSRIEAERTYDPSADNNVLENTLEGYGRSGYHLGQKVANLATHAAAGVGLESAKRALAGHGFNSDEAIQNREETDKALLDTAGGSLGNLAGDIVNTLPLGGVGGLASKGAVTAGRALGAGKILSRALGSGATKAGVEGLIQGAATGDQGDLGVAGAATGGALGLVGAAGRRMISGLVEKSGDANVLEALAHNAGKDIHLPLSLAASNKGIISDTAGGIYRHGLAMVPGASGTLENQAKKAAQALRDIAAEKSTPAGANISSYTTEIARQGEIKDAFDEIYNRTVKPYTFDIPVDLKDRMAASIRNKMPGVDDTTVKNVVDMVAGKVERFASGKGAISGGNLLNARNLANAGYKELEGPEREALGHAITSIDDIVDNKLANGTKQMADHLAEYRAAADPYKNFVRYSKAVGKAQANSGEFTMAQLAKSASPVHTPDLYELGASGHKVIGGEESKHGRVLNSMFRGATTIGGAIAVPHVTIGAIAGGNLLATKAAQNALLGKTKLQQRLVKALARKHAGDVTSSIRHGIVSGVVD